MKRYYALMIMSCSFLGYGMDNTQNKDIIPSTGEQKKQCMERILNWLITANQHDASLILYNFNLIKTTPCVKEYWLDVASDEGRNLAIKLIRDSETIEDIFEILNTMRQESLYEVRNQFLKNVVTPYLNDCLETNKLEIDHLECRKKIVPYVLNDIQQAIEAIFKAKQQKTY